MAILITGAYSISQQGTATVVSLNITLGGSSFSGNYVRVNAAKMAEISAAIVTAGGTVPGPQFAIGVAYGVPDFAPLSRYVGYPIWDFSNTGEVEVFFPGGFTCSGNIEFQILIPVVNP